MRFSSLLAIATGFLLASSEAFSLETSAKLSTENFGTRFLRTDATTNDDEERGVKVTLSTPVKMNFAGHLRDSDETTKWLQMWLLKGDSEASVAAKLGVNGLEKAAAKKHANWGAYAKYLHMQKRAGKPNYFAHFGTGYQSEKKTKDVVWRWAVEGQTEAYAAGLLGMSKLSKDQYKLHWNYNAYEEFLKAQEKMADLRKKFGGRVNLAQ
ncbi:hypothetical protein PR002_g23791 [Phytophthora rubi]|uniref:RxLR effector protein n=2 Tax=Phytophthora rubi TaxID=129364 RepID=A0A6A3IEL0_9STRA|nr:hypothetical protein PR002_g23791 [Phytophthora rubi]